MLARRADTDEFDGFAVKRKAEAPAELFSRIGEVVILRFDSRAAFSADQELVGMLVIRHRASDESFRAVDPMHEALRDQEFEGPVNARRGRGIILFSQAVENFVGGQGCLSCKDSPKHHPALRR